MYIYIYICAFSLYFHIQTPSFNAGGAPPSDNAKYAETALFTS